MAVSVLQGGCAAEEETPDRRPEARVPNPSQETQPPIDRKRPEADVILVLGNSIAAGYGLDPQQAFPALLQERVDSLGWDYEVINAGLSGETTAGGLRRLEWLLQSPVDVLVIELGGNDGLRGLPTETTRDNLARMIDLARERSSGVSIILTGMQMPPNLGADYTERFREIYIELAREKDVALVPFLLEGVGGVARLNQPDGIHPTAEGQRIVAGNVWKTLRPLLEVRQEGH